MSIEVISRKEAIARGIKWFFTGVPCPRGHTAKRSVSNNECRGCVNAKARQQRIDRPERLRAKDKRKYWKAPEVMKSRSKAMREKHHEKRLEWDRNRYHTDPARKAYQLKQAHEWWKKTPENRAKRILYTNTKRAHIKRATPKWLSASDRKKISEIYHLASTLNNGSGRYHVDHIVPLRGKLVSGLHVPWNLQILTAQQNQRKRNVFEQT